MSDDFQSHERVGTTKLNRSLTPGRCIKRARRITNSSTSASTVLVPTLRLDGAPIYTGRQYTIVTSSCLFDTSNVGDMARIALTYTTDGSTPTTASPILPGGQDQVYLGNTSSGVHAKICTPYIPTADETLSLLLSIARVQGAGTVQLLADGTHIIDLRIIDQGEDPGDTGVDL